MTAHIRDLARPVARASDAERLASQRVAGTGTLSVRLSAGRTRVATLGQAGAAKIRLPSTAGDPLEAILINTAGGMTGGDRLDWRIEAQAGASAVVTTQACEKAYRAAAGEARVRVSLRVEKDASIAWLPQETIVYDRAAMSRRIDVDLAATASALILEATIFGRAAMGERVTSGAFRDRWRVAVDGRLVHAEDFSIGGDIAGLLDRNAVAHGARAMATLLVIRADAERLLDAARDAIGDKGGASAWSVGGSGKLLARLVARDGYSLRQRLMPLLALLNERAALPKVWSL